MQDRGPIRSSRSAVVALRADQNETALLNRIISAQSDIAAAVHDPKEVVDVVIKRTQELTRSEGAAVELLEGDELVYIAASGVASRQIGLRIPIGHSLAGMCVANNQVLWCDDAEFDPRVNREACRQVGLRSMLVAPLLHAGRPIGALKVMSPYASAYRDTDVRTLERMSALIGSALGHAMKHDRLARNQRPAPDAAKDMEQERSDWEDRIRSLLVSRQIRTVFQPVVRLADRAVTGYEALSRFPAGTGTPDVWFSMASEVGLGIALELEALRSALSHLGSIPEPLHLSINLSPETLMAPALEDALRPYDKSRLILEITEHSTVADYEVMGERILALQRQGLEFAIDDAGAGFASLRHILQLMPDVIKLDISLTRRIDHDKRRQALVSAILSFAHRTSARVVVEGVETAGELDALVALGVEFGQGYYLGRPEALPPP